MIPSTPEQLREHVHGWSVATVRAGCLAAMAEAPVLAALVAAWLSGLDVGTGSPRLESE